MPVAKTAIDHFDLTPKQREYVQALVRYGMNPSQAAEHAGYSHPTSSGTLTRNPKIQQAVQELTKAEINSLAPQAVSVIVKLMSDAKSDYVKLQAAQDLLNRAGYTIDNVGQSSSSGSLSVTLNLGGDAPIGTSPKTIDLKAEPDD